MVKIESDRPRCPICGAEAYRGSIAWDHSPMEHRGPAATRLNVYCMQCQLEITLQGFDVIGKWNKHLKQEDEE